MKVIIASKNPVKIDAARSGFEQFFPKDVFHFEGSKIASGVSDQPMSDSETLQGAINRATNARISFPKADFWVGVEGGIHEGDLGMEAFAWVVIQSGDRQGQSRTSTFFLPPKVTKLIHQGVELGHANDRIFAEHNSKQKGGAIGSLTHGLLGRTAYYVQAVLLALIPFKNPELYQ
jgi:inosine/xanthosine triphosphatase